MGKEFFLSWMTCGMEITLNGNHSTIACKNGLHESKILVTTRKESVASMMGSTDIIYVKKLT